MPGDRGGSDKVQDANSHRRKKADKGASTGVTSTSATTVVPEAPPGSGRNRDKPTSKKGHTGGDKGKDRERGHVDKDRGDRDKGSRERAKREDARRAKETADEKDLEEEESDKREYIALQNKMEAKRIAREIQAAHDTLASLRSEQATTSSKPAASS